MGPDRGRIGQGGHDFQARVTDCTFAIVERSCLSQIDIPTETPLSNKEG